MTAVSGWAVLSSVTCAVRVRGLVEVPTHLLLSGAGGLHVVLAQAGSRLELTSN